MEMPIVKIGNSKGLRIKKSILERYHIKDKVEVVFEKDQIVLRPVGQPRQGWDEAFRAMHAKGDDALLLNDVFQDENPEEWL